MEEKKLKHPELSWEQFNTIIHSISNVTMRIVKIELSLKDRPDLQKELAKIRQEIGRGVREIYKVINGVQNHIMNNDNRKRLDC